jgi:hypothetical protein
LAQALGAQTIYEIKQALHHCPVQLSRLVIHTNHDYALELVDYKVFVPLNPLCKALYLLFLRHPEGIVLKEMSRYQAELWDIYLQVCRHDDLKKAKESVAELCNPLSNSIHEKISRIKATFEEITDNHVATHYIIAGARGKAKKIALDPALVCWQ